jgi:hypothetical protein
MALFSIFFLKKKIVGKFISRFSVSLNSPKLCELNLKKKKTVKATLNDKEHERFNRNALCLQVRKNNKSVATDANRGLCLS